MDSEENSDGDVYIERESSIKMNFKHRKNESVE